jgi:hypothetical protein
VGSSLVGSPSRPLDRVPHNIGGVAAHVLSFYFLMICFVRGFSSLHYIGSVVWLLL